MINIKSISSYNIFVVKEELTVGFHADKSLQSFCKWQQKINPQENSHDVLVNGIAHHDNAILLTRFVFGIVFEHCQEYNVLFCI